MTTKADKQDTLFSIMIRERDGNKCIWCSKRAPEWRMTNSHYWGRKDKIHRFDPLNCDCLCFTCHEENESNKQGKYREYKIAQLGEPKYMDMQRKHYQESKKYGVFEKAKLFKILKEQYANKEHLKKGWTVDW